MKQTKYFTPVDALLLHFNSFIVKSRVLQKRLIICDFGFQVGGRLQCIEAGHVFVLLVSCLNLHGLNLFF